MLVLIDGKPVQAKQVVVVYDIRDKVPDATHFRLTMTPKRIKEEAWDARTEEPKDGVSLACSPGDRAGFGFENSSRTPHAMACDIT